MASERVPSKKAVKAKFRIGQVVSVRSFIEKRHPGEVGPGYEGKTGWRWGWEFGRIAKILPPSPHERKPIFCYFLAEWMSALDESDLRPLTKRERGNCGE